jgi:hypothetical protein
MADRDAVRGRRAGHGVEQAMPLAGVGVDVVAQARPFQVTAGGEGESAVPGGVACAVIAGGDRAGDRARH